MSLQVAKKIKAYPFTIFEILFLKYTRQFYIGIGNIGHFFKSPQPHLYFLALLYICIENPVFTSYSSSRHSTSELLIDMRTIGLIFPSAEKFSCTRSYRRVIFFNLSKN